MRLSWRKTVIIASTWLGLAACGADAAEMAQSDRRAGGVVYLNMGDEIPAMDPAKGTDSLSFQWIGHVYEGLMTRDQRGMLVPGTASSVETSPDGRVVTFVIRPEARWHDGKPVTARDFEFAFRRVVDPATASQYGFIMTTAGIVNAESVLAGKAKPSALGVRALDDRRFEVRLSRAVPFFPSLMAFPVFFPVRQDLVRKFGDRFCTSAESIVGNGPFRVDRWRREASIRIERFPGYWNAREIKLNAIEAPVIVKDPMASYNLFSTGGIDITSVGGSPEVLKIAQKDKRPIRSFEEGSVWYWEINQRNGRVFADKRLREALRLAMNRGEYVNKMVGVPGTKVARGLVPDYMPGSRPGMTFRREAPLSMRDGDVSGARAMIQEYLKATGQTRVPTFTILSDDGARSKVTAEYLQSALSAAFGTEVRIDLVPFKTRLQKMRDGAFDLVFAGWGPDYMDPMTFLDLFTTMNENNHTGFSNKRFDALITSAQVEKDAARRLATLAEAERVLVEGEVVIVPIYQRTGVFTTAKGLAGVIRTQVGTDPDLRFARWQ